MKKLPIGMQTFSEIIEEKYLYIDKTEEIYNLLTGGGKYYFLSRPRRFGKSLMVSTLKEIFSGNKKLFKDLWIYDKWGWEKYPVIHLDFLGLQYGSKKELIETLEFMVNGSARTYGIELKEKRYDKKFKELIEALSRKNKVVILVDEYDKPIIDNIENRETAWENRNILRTFYESIKGADQYLKFVFITGVSKFSKVSIFSGLNNLTDITLDEKYSTLLGYTENDFQSYFGDEVEKMSKLWAVSPDELFEKVKRWYNGYSWDGKNTLYNPVSIHYFISRQEFGNYWFSTATPTFLIKIIKEKELSIMEFEDIETESSEFDSYDVDNLQVTPILFQTGYLTVERVAVDVGEKTYYLSYPNKEVRESFLKHFLRSYTGEEPSLSSKVLKKLKESLYQDDLHEFFTIMKSLFASLPYDMIVKDREGYYQTVIYLVLTLTGIDTHTEIETNRGRLDALIETDYHIYIMEYKLDTPESAISQIKEKKYYEKYLSSGKAIKIVGVGFDMEQRNISDFTTEEVS